MTTLVGLARLVRVSIALSPVADGVVAATLAHAAGRPIEPARLAAALATSLALFLFGMALNDRCDADQDARLRPDRPIPAGAVSRRAATIVCLATLAAALAFGIAAAAGRPVALGLLAGLIAAITLYDATPGHLGPIGPPLLGAIRAQNFLFTAAILGAERIALPAALAYGAYILCVGWIARTEDGSVAPTRERLVCGVMGEVVFLAAAPAVVLAQREEVCTLATGLVPAACVMLLAIRLKRALSTVLAVEPLARAPIPRLVGTALSGIFLFHAAIAAAAGALLVTLGLVLVDPLARHLARRFPPS